MTLSRRAFGRLVLGSTISAQTSDFCARRCPHTAKAFGAPGALRRPFNAHFVDVAASAGLTAPTIYGGVESKKYILEPLVVAALLSITTTTMDGSFILSERDWEGAPPGTTTDCTRTIAMARSRMSPKSRLTAVGWASAVCVGDYNNNGF